MSFLGDVIVPLAAHIVGMAQGGEGRTNTDIRTRLFRFVFVRWKWEHGYDRSLRCENELFSLDVGCCCCCCCDLRRRQLHRLCYHPFLLQKQHPSLSACGRTGAPLFVGNETLLEFLASVALELFL